ncbi:unnamed protein product [Parnassius apollo]|uniref:(apollo) hypothetical protein n=1 Tax=Parnassius apollo TaxID=110799 RepID=A0A8S3XV26_PARAO|nr:unnamed protein product [Parnassius apollo]
MLSMPPTKKKGVMSKPAATNVETCRCLVLKSLNDSEYESNSEEDPFEDNGTDDKYSPNNEREESSSSSSSSCEDEVSVDEDDNELCKFKAVLSIWR